MTRGPKSPAIFIPSFGVNIRGRTVSRRCYVASETKLILPAYGAFTGGLDASHPEIHTQGRPGRVGAGPGDGPTAPLPDRRLGELRRDQAAHNIADVKATFQV